MEAEEARQFKARWQAVNAHVIDEARRASPSDKLRQLALMYEARQALGWADARAAGEDEVRARWRRLRDIYHARA